LGLVAASQAAGGRTKRRAARRRYRLLGGGELDRPGVVAGPSPFGRVAPGAFEWIITSSEGSVAMLERSVRPMLVVVGDVVADDAFDLSAVPDEAAVE